MAAEIRPVLDGKPGRIGTPIDVSEESQINGFVFSSKLLQAARLATRVLNRFGDHGLEPCCKLLPAAISGER